NPVKVCFAGVPDTSIYFQELKKAASELGVDQRIDWAGRISNEDKCQRYSNCLGVVYPPLDEDYGYVTLEAMLSSKAVITCSDSGGTREFIDSGSGFVTEPAAACLAQALDTLWENRQQARQMGKSARDRYCSMNITWTHVLRQLLA